jgi:CBS domain-containing protein
MVTVRELLLEKGNDVWTIGPDKTVFDALMLMAAKQIGALVVTDDEDVVGVISERDYARKVILKGRSSKSTPLREIMSTRVCYVTRDHNVHECMALMTDKTVRHLPVIEDGKLVGIVSIGDVVKSVISEQEFIIDRLEAYITGK